MTFADESAPTGEALKDRVVRDIHFSRWLFRGYLVLLFLVPLLQVLKVGGAQTIAKIVEKVLRWGSWGSALLSLAFILINWSITYFKTKKFILMLRFLPPFVFNIDSESRKSYEIRILIQFAIF